MKTILKALFVISMTFLSAAAQAQESIKDQPTPTLESVLLNWLPMLTLIGIWMLVMKKMQINKVMPSDQMMVDRGEFEKMMAMIKKISQDVQDIKRQ